MPFDMSDQWGIACGSVAGLPYVNGTTPEAGVCNVGLATADCESRLGQPQCAPTDVDIMGGEFPSCVSPSGAVDMIGNVAEWVGQCGGGGDAGTLCQKRGGSFADDLATATCFWQPTAAIDTRDRTVGFRCCASLTAAELARAGR
jgi:formylglycine-generating enzyme required for sulfatase activity